MSGMLKWVSAALSGLVVACTQSGDGKPGRGSERTTGSANDSVSAPRESAMPGRDSTRDVGTRAAPPAPMATPSPTAADTAKPAAPSERRFPKGARTDSGFRPPRESLRVRMPERHPVYPPLEHPMTVPRDSGAKRDTSLRSRHQR